MRRTTVVLTAAALLLSACDGGAADDPTATPTSPSPTEEESPSPSPSPSPTPTETTPSPTPTVVRSPLDEVAVSWTEAGDGFERPLQVLQDPRDGTVLVVEQRGRIRTLDGDTVLDLRDRVTRAANEQGMLGVAFHPDATRLFVHYSGEDGQTVLSEFPAGGGSIAADQETVLLTEGQPAGNHNGGALLFDPDGALVLALGDGGGGGDQFGNGQNTDTRLGGLLRLDVDTEPGQVRPFAGNPFTDGGAPELWTYGLRNPWRVDFDDTHLYIADVGQNAVEEVNVIARDEVAGANFGWPILEGTECFQEAGCDASGTVQPVAELRHSDGACSIIGGVIVPDASPTGLAGAFLYSDFCDTELRAVRRTSDGIDVAAIQGGQLPGSPLGFGAGSDGQVWVGTSDGQVLELRPA